MGRILSSDEEDPRAGRRRMSAPLKVGIIGLAEAGNLGDDLILIATVNAVYAASPQAEVSFVSFGQVLDWDRLSQMSGRTYSVQRILARTEIPIFRQNARVHRDRDVVIFGGGGLLQTSHQINRPYGWLSYLPSAGTGSPRVLATGLGLGPISEAWVHRLRRMGTPFDLSWFRDPDSVALSRDELWWPGEACRDFVDEEFLLTLPFKRKERRSGTRRLGIALRAWPGLSVDAAASHVEAVARRHLCEDLVFFVLESNRGRGVDVNFSEAVAKRLSRPARVRAYEARVLIDFMEDLASVDLAISMKLHSSAIWGAFAVPMYPIYYAPKVAAFFGVEYRGFEVVDEIVPVPVMTKNAPRAQETIVANLQELAEKRGAEGSRFSLADRYRYQVENLARAAIRRLCLLPRIKKEPSYE